MIYTEMTKKAMKFAFKAHLCQPDKNGMPYIFHPYHLAEQMDSEETVVIALLHDIVEDTKYTFEDISEQGFSEKIIVALRLLTREPDSDYEEYILRIKNSKNPDAIKVKLADLKHNSDLSRLDYIDEKVRDRIEKYKKAIDILTSKR